MVSFRKFHLTGDLCLGWLGSDPLPDALTGGREDVQVLHDEARIIPENWRKSGKQEGGDGGDIDTTARRGTLWVTVSS